MTVTRNVGLCSPIYVLLEFITQHAAQCAALIDALRIAPYGLADQQVLKQIDRKEVSVARMSGASLWVLLELIT